MESGCQSPKVLWLMSVSHTPRPRTANDLLNRTTMNNTTSRTEHRTFVNDVSPEIVVNDQQRQPSGQCTNWQRYVWLRLLWSQRWWTNEHCCLFHVADCIQFWGEECLVELRRTGVQRRVQIARLQSIASAIRRAFPELHRWFNIGCLPISQSKQPLMRKGFFQQLLKAEIFEQLSQPRQIASCVSDAWSSSTFILKQDLYDSVILILWSTNLLSHNKGSEGTCRQIISSVFDQRIEDHYLTDISIKTHSGLFVCLL
jgi:hypothetical protein